jgi:RHS repeat-associated protein
VTDALGHTTLFSLDGRGNVLQMTNALGEVTSYSYDSRGLVTSITDASGAQTTMNYDQHGREVLRTDAMGTEFHTQYDINGNPLTKSFMITVGNELVEVRAEAVYDRNGRAISLTDPAGFTSSVAYDRNGNQLSSSDPLGRTTSFVYDERGNRTEAILPNGLSVRQQFDAAGRPVNTERPGGITSTVGYDVAGQTTSVTEVGVPMGDTAQDVGVTLTYDALGRLIGSDDGIVPPLVREYDEAGNMVRVSSGAASMVQAYDAVGRITSTTDALGSTSIIDYDALGRASRIAYASGMEFTFTYDARGNIIATEDSIGRRVVQVYDALNRLTKVVLPDGSETTYGYNERGDLISVVDANGNETQYEYDLRGNRTATIRPLGGRDIYNYNAAGELTGVQWANGQSLTYVLDAMGRITEKRHGDVVVETLTYTEFGGVRSVIDTRGQTLFEYDDAGRLIQRTEPDGRFLRYNYSVDGNILALSSNDSLTTYEYNDLGQLESVTSDGATTVYQYDDLGRITTTTLPNGVVERRTFGVGDTVTRVWTERNGTVLSDIRYTYDEFARVLSQERVGSFLVTYSYDVNDRLLLEQYEAANGDTWSISYAYDAVGNRLVRVDSRSGTTMYTYNINDQLIAETTNGQTTTYVYDATGNLISKTDAARGVETYEWDGERRLTAVRTANGDQQFQYDLFGDRVASFDGDGETRYLLDAQREYTQVFEALNVPTSQVTSYVFGAGRIAVRTGSDVRYYHGDSQDSTRLLTDGNGAVLAKFDLDAYGNLLDDNAIGEQFLFAGEQRDLATGFDYLRARYYDPRLGRMLSVDPLDGLLSDPVTLHRYLYGNGSPTNFTDPSGEFSLTETLVSLGKISLLAGAITGTVGAAALAILGDRVWDGWQALMTISTSGMAGASPFGKLPDLGLTLGGSYLKAKFPNGDGGGFSLTGLHLIVATTFSSPNFPLLDKLDKAAGKAPASVRTAGNVAIPLTAFGWFPLAVAGALASYSPIDIAVAKTTVHAPDFYPGIAPISGPYISVLGTASAGIGLAPVGGLAGGGSAAAVGGLLQGFGFGYSILSPGFTIKPRLGIDLIAGLAIPVSPAIRKPL